MYVPALYGALVKYSGNSLCDERTHKLYMECQYTTLVNICVMNTRPEAFVSYYPIFKRKFCERMTLIRIST